MKTLYLLISFTLYAFFLPNKSNAQTGSVDFQIFYDELSPYGTWIENPDYGYVWIPDVAADFIPYTTNGYWVFTDDGWTWVSDFSWGWAPFHYGRWYTDERYGSVWVPDYQWGPGWVSWRSSEDYFGWAPMRPGISFNLYFNNHFSVPNSDWTFINGKNFGRRNSNEYYINPVNNTTIIHNTIIINNPRTDRERNVTYSLGPDKREVEKHIGSSVPSYAIRENEQHVQRINNGQMQIYRPMVRPASNGTKPAPSNIKSLNEVRTKEEKRTERPQQQNLPPQKQEQPQPQQRQVQPQPQKRQEQPQPQQRQVQPQPQQKQNQAPQRQEQPQPQQKQNQPPQRQEQPQPQQKQNQPPQRQEQPQPQQKQNQPPQRQEQPQPQQKQNQPPQRQEQPQPQQRPVQSPPKQNTPPKKQQQPPKQNIPPQKGKETIPRKDSSHLLMPDLKIQLN